MLIYINVDDNKNTVHCQSKLLNLYFIRRKEGGDVKKYLSCKIVQHVPATLYQEEYNKFTVAFLSCSKLQQIFAGRFKQDFNILRKMQLLEEKTAHQS